MFNRTKLKASHSVQCVCVFTQLYPKWNYYLPINHWIRRRRQFFSKSNSYFYIHTILFRSRSTIVYYCCEYGRTLHKKCQKKKVFVEGNPSALYQCIGKICINTINVLHWCATIDKFDDQKPDDQNYTLTMKGQNELVDSWQTNFVLISDSICSPIVLMTFSWMSMSHTHKHTNTIDTKIRWHWHVLSE